MLFKIEAIDAPDDIKHFTGEGIKWETDDNGEKTEACGIYRGVWKNGKFIKGTYIFPYCTEMYGVKQVVMKEIPYANGIGIHDGYEGEWKLGKRHGHGIYKFKTGSIYQGHWESGKISGKGIMIFDENSKYEGEWLNGCMHGFGILKIKENFIYSGMWKNGKLDGGATVQYPNGDVYDGEWKIGKRHGKGEYRWANGDKFCGNWQYNLPINDVDIYRQYMINPYMLNINSETNILTHNNNTQMIPCKNKEIKELGKNGIDSSTRYINFKESSVPYHTWNTLMTPFKTTVVKINYYGLFKKVSIYDKFILDYKFFTNKGDLDIVKTTKYRLILERNNLLKLLNTLGKMGILPLGNKKYIQTMLIELGWAVAP